MNETARPLPLLDLPASRWRDALGALDLEPYRGDQIARWVFQRGVFDPAEMTDLPLGLRARLPELVRVRPAEVAQVFTSVDHSRRYLLDMGPGQVVEAVAMPCAGRLTLCISSQVGCRFACTFCQTGRLGLARSLEVGEMVGQVVRLRAEAGAVDGRLNVVFMGQGEPLDNADAVRQAVVALQDPRGPGLSWRRITVSTVGLVPAIEALGAMGEARPRIAVSLNASTDALRSSLMPVNRKYPIAALLGVLRALRWRPRERVTIEYVLLAGVNDAVEDARRLAKLLHGLPAKVNLIPWNPVPTMPYTRPAPAVVERFRTAALDAGLDALVRYSRGADIGAACGQLQAAAGAVARLG